MKNFNWEKFKKVCWFAAAVLVISVLWPFQDTFTVTEDIHANRFCAYGQVYVEFNHGGKTWGTTFLDDRGRPVHCTDDTDIQHTVSNKEII